MSLDRRELLTILRILRRDPLSIVGGVIVVGFAVTALVVLLLGNAITPYNPNAIN